MLKFKIVIIQSLLFLLIINTSQALAISGKEIKELIKEHLLIQGITSNPLIRESRQFKDCNHKLNIDNPYDSFRTVIVSCKTPLKWQVSIRTNAESKLQTKSKSKNSKDFKNIKLITLKHNLKRGELSSDPMKAAWDKKCGSGNKKKKPQTALQKVSDKVGAVFV